MIFGGSVRVLKEYTDSQIEAEELEDISLQYGISSVPAFVFLLGKASQEKMQGADPPKFLQKVRELQKRAETACLGDDPSKVSFVGVIFQLRKFHHLEDPSFTVRVCCVIKNALFQSPASQSTGEALEARLKRLIESGNVMIFMKGNPQQPRCGFSRKAIEILSEHKVKFAHFDILTDNDVREGLKKYSNWPSYPQLYVNGRVYEFPTNITNIPTNIINLVRPRPRSRESSLERRLS